MLGKVTVYCLQQTWECFLFNPLPESINPSWITEGTLHTIQAFSKGYPEKNRSKKTSWGDRARAANQTEKPESVVSW